MDIMAKTLRTSHGEEVEEAVHQEEVMFKEEVVIDKEIEMEILSGEEEAGEVMTINISKMVMMMKNFNIKLLLSHMNQLKKTSLL